MKQFLVLCFFLVLTPFTALCMTPEQKAMIHEHFEKIGFECLKTNAITEDDISNLRARKMPTGPNAPCFLACVMRNIGVLDDQGMLQKETALELARTVFEDEEEIKLIGDYLHSCNHINSESVGDGTKGCERAIKAYKCMTENASQFGFEI